MDPIATTADLASRCWARMAHNLETLRRRGVPALTLSDKLLFGHLEDPEAALPAPAVGTLSLRPDRVVLQDVLGQTAMLQFAQTGRRRVALPTSIHCDHLIQARAGGEPDLRDSLAENDEVYAFLRSAAAKYGAVFWQPGAGIIHQVVLEQYAFPGALILGTDSHTPNAGGLGACAVGVGGADAVEAMAGLPFELLRPRRIGVVLTGSLTGWSAPKDVILWLAGRLGTAGATNAILEYLGPGARTLSATGKATIANMGAELGATTSLFPADDAIADYLRATGRGELVEPLRRHAALLAPDPEVKANPAAHYEQLIALDLSALEPHVVGPHSPDRARPLSALAAEVAAARGAIEDRVSVALLGSCTNSSYQDMSRAADVAQQAAAHGVCAASALLVTPGSEQIRATLARDGQLAALERIGARVLANACGPCIGNWRRSAAPAAEDAPSTIVSSFNRNFPGRNDGRRATQAFIASPEIVTALALAGRLSFDPRRDALVGAGGARFRLDPPAQAAALPREGYATGRDLCVPPPEDGADLALAIREGSERLAPLAPWPAWDGRDLLELPLLQKTRGKTTTDQISPAGPWLRYRGHLERFSDNLLSGAIDAFRGTPRDDIAQTARALRARGLRWVVVGDANYGEGSSREHAALSPRLLGGAAVIARSFARIHESNLKKQGLLALCFRDPADYERVCDGDRVSLLGLAELAAGAPVECVLSHANGSREHLWLDHSYSDAQLEWFRAGSALNALRREDQRALHP
jgi:aconitate hydratase